MVFSGGAWWQRFGWGRCVYWAFVLVDVKGHKTGFAVAKRPERHFGMSNAAVRYSFVSGG